VRRAATCGLDQLSCECCELVVGFVSCFVSHDVHVDESSGCNCIYSAGESDEWHVVHAKNLKDETKLIEAGFEYICYSQKDDVAIYRKRK